MLAIWLRSRHDAMGALAGSAICNSAAEGPQSYCSHDARSHMPRAARPTFDTSASSACRHFTAYQAPNGPSTHRICSRQQSLQNMWPQSMAVAWEAGTSDMQTKQDIVPLAPAVAAIVYAAASSDRDSRPARLYTSSWPRSAMVPATQEATRAHRDGWSWVEAGPGLHAWQE